MKLASILLKNIFHFSPSNNGLQSQLVTMTYDGTNPGDFTLSGFGIDLSDGLILVPGEVSSIQEAIDLANDGDTVSVARYLLREHRDSQ